MALQISSTLHSPSASGSTRSHSQHRAIQCTSLSPGSLVLCPSPKNTYWIRVKAHTLTKEQTSIFATRPSSSGAPPPDTSLAFHLCSTGLTVGSWKEGLGRRGLAGRGGVWGPGPERGLRPEPRAPASPAPIAALAPRAPAAAPGSSAPAPGRSSTCAACGVL